MCDTQADRRPEQELDEFEAWADDTQALAEEGLISVYADRVKILPAGRKYGQAKRPIPDFNGTASQCQECSKPFALAQLVFDAPINYNGSWAFMCGPCFNLQGTQQGSVHVYTKQRRQSADEMLDRLI